MKIHITNPLLIKVNPVARTLEDPKYRPKTILSKKVYNRKKENDRLRKNNKGMRRGYEKS